MSLSNTFGKCLTGRVSLAGTSWRPVLGKAVLVSLVGSVIILAVEPDHTAGLPVLAAYGLWFTHILIMLLLFGGSVAVLLRLGLPEPFPAVAATVLLPAIFAPVSMVLDYGFGNPDEELAASGSLSSAYLSEVVAVVPVSLAAALVMVAVLYREALSRRRPEAHVAPDAPPLHDLIAAIPITLGDDLIRLHAQDHYVEVVTAEGRTLIMERFNDCVDRLARIEGIQCHRSHWISLRHVESLSRSGSAYVCTLDNGERVPVSRRRYPDLKKKVAGSGGVEPH